MIASIADSNNLPRSRTIPHAHLTEENRIEPLRMQFGIKITSGEEVKGVGFYRSSPMVFYGGPPPESGSWKVSMTLLENHLDDELKNSSFGESIDKFILGFEIADIEGWGRFLTAMTDYVSYRPKIKTVVSVAQLNWPDVKDLGGLEQFHLLTEVILQAISRISSMKRKPRHFDVKKFYDEVHRILSECRADEMIEEEPVC